LEARPLQSHSRSRTSVDKKGETPEFIRCDNGPELTANALRDWCRFSGTGTSNIEPGSPWENPFVESFGSRLRDELLSVEHGWRSPVAYATAWKAENEVDRLSQEVDL